MRMSHKVLVWARERDVLPTVLLVTDDPEKADEVALAAAITTGRAVEIEVTEV